MPGAGSGWSFGDLRAIVIWAAVGIFVAVRRFRWEPGAGERRRVLVRGARTSA